MKFFLDILLLLPLLIFCSLESFVKLFLPKRRKSVTGEIVLITGAGHGIGRLTAYEFAKLKSKLVLWDINKHGLEETAAKCRGLGAKVHTFMVDCSNREDIYNSAKKTTKAFLPAMMKNNHGHIVTVASAAGHTVVPFLLAYCLGPTLEPEEVVNKLMNGILTEQKMIFVPSSIAFLTILERILPDRFLVTLKQKINVRFDAVIGYKMKA
uniref:Estradiol 17-beta-dehydrogenase 11 n=1 Tax=Saimiri boliviensis boliviensis TaxID=39432 RepID=A0A2K6UXU5_SAIBB